MYIVTEQHFSQELIRPDNGSELYASTDSNPFEAWVDEYARLCLQNALGNVLFADFDSNVIAGVLTPGVTKWDNLVNGTTYTYNDKSYTWKGLLVTEGISKRSLLADYVYSQWYKEQHSYLSNMGEVQGSAINGHVISPSTRYYKTWNSFVRAYQGSTRPQIHGCVTHQYLPLYVEAYYGGYYADDNGYVPLITFLKHNEADYPDAKCKLYDLMNFAGI